jgi:hypothetical protein
MSQRRIGLVVALIAAALLPGAAMAQKKPAAINEADRKAGMAEAPAAAQSAGLSCQVSDARKIGQTKGDKKAGTPDTNFYEVACGTGMGFVLSAPVGAAATPINCLEANRPGPDGKEASIACKLPANADPKAALAPVLAAGKVQCTPTAARGIGSSKTNSFTEVACQEGPGYVVITDLKLDPAQKVEAQNCLSFDDAEGNVKCTLSDKATRLAIVDKLASQAGKNCQVKDRGFLGASTDGSNFYESSCQDGKGYVYKVSTAGALVQTVDCGQAASMLGGCKLTDSRQAASEQAGLYTKLAKAAGSNCDVDRYAIFPTSGKEEVVEMVCKDGKGAVGIFPATGAGKVVDCGHAPVAGYQCSLSKDMKSAYASLTADLKKFNQMSCDVSASRLAGKTKEGTTLLEVACADGLKGYVIEYNPDLTAKASVGCALAGGCKLPGNV